MATKTKSTKITSVRKGDIYETNSGQLIEVTNGRLQDEGQHGSSFAGRTIEFNLETGNPNRSKTTDRFYLDELAKKLTKKDYDEWVEIGRREVEAMADAQAPLSQQQLADELSLDKATMVRAIDHLSAEGYVARRPCPNDRRKHHLELLPKARPLVRSIRRSYSSLNSIALDGMPAAERWAAIQEVKYMVERLKKANSSTKTNPSSTR